MDWIYHVLGVLAYISLVLLGAFAFRMTVNLRAFRRDEPLQDAPSYTEKDAWFDLWLSRAALLFCVLTAVWGLVVLTSKSLN